MQYICGHFNNPSLSQFQHFLKWQSPNWHSISINELKMANNKSILNPQIN